MVRTSTFGKFGDLNCLPSTSYWKAQLMEGLQTLAASKGTAASSAVGRPFGTGEEDWNLNVWKHGVRDPVTRMWDSSGAKLEHCPSDVSYEHRVDNPGDRCCIEPAINEITRRACNAVGVQRSTTGAQYQTRATMPSSLREWLSWQDAYCRASSQHYGS